MCNTVEVHDARAQKNLNISRKRKREALNKQLLLKVERDTSRESSLLVVENERIPHFSDHRVIVEAQQVNNVPI